jgi:hypothetical protein
MGSFAAPALRVPIRGGLALLAGAMALVLGGSLSERAGAAEANQVEASSSAEAREEARQAIPWQKLVPDERRAVEQLVNSASIYRRMPTRVIDCDPELFNFLGKNPEVVTEIWRMMGVCQLKLERTGRDTFSATDAAGTVGGVRMLHSEWNPGAQNRVLVYSEGTYCGKPFPRPVKARSISLLRSGSVVETNGRPYVTARLDTFVVIDRWGIELVAKTVQPLLASTADHNFVETMKFVSTFSKTSEVNPDGMQRLSDKLVDLSLDTRHQMATACQATAARYQSLSKTEGPSIQLVRGDTAPTDVAGPQ